jgi:ankyrin repeat protein
MAEFLMAKGADVNAKNNEGQTPIDIAMNQNHKDIVELLLEKGAKFSIHVAAYLGDIDKVNSFIETGISVNVESGPRRRTPLYWAVKNKHKDMAKLLIDKGADTSSINLLYYACWNGYRDFVELFIQRGADANSKSWGESPSHYAVWGDHADVLELLLAHGANPNAKDTDGWPLLHYAAGSGSTDMTKMLLEKGADVNAKDKDGQTSLHRAAEKGHTEVTELLIAKGADANAKDNQGRTALWYAEQRGHTEIVELLKKYEANPMSTTKGHKSVLLSPDSASGMDEVCDLILDSPAPGKQNFGWDPACGDVNGDGYDDVVATAAAWNNGTRRGRVYLYYGGMNMDAIPDKIFTGEADGDYFGDGCGVGDVNGDNYADVLVGAPCFSGGAEDGRVYVFHGGPEMDEKADLILEGESGSGGYYGIDIGAGDLNRDGYDDVVVTAVKMNSWKGRAYLYYGGNPMDSTCDLIFEGENESDAFGRTVFLGDGDVNGDHYPDLLIQAKQYPGGKNRGRIYLYYGGDPMDNICDKTFTGENDRDEFGEGNCLIDVDNDGFCDVIIGADCWPARERIQGRVYLYWGSKDMDGHADKIFTGEHGAALSVVYGGYFNNDEYGDILTGAWGYKHFDLRGQAQIYYGGIKGQMDEVADCILSNDAPKSRFGMRLTSGDVNGDGYDDAIINGFGYNNQQGRIWLYHGEPDE